MQENNYAEAAFHVNLLKDFRDQSTSKIVSDYCKKAE